MTVTRSFCSAVYAAPDTGLVHEEVFWPYSRLEIRQGSVSYICTGQKYAQGLVSFCSVSDPNRIMVLREKIFGSFQPIHANKVNFFS